MYNTHIEVFFELLRAGLWERDVKSLALFPIEKNIWSKVIALSKEQTVLGVIYKGIKRLPNEYLPPKDILFRLIVEVDRIEKLNSKSNEVIIELVDLYSKENVFPILQKGQGVAQFYEEPLLRVCGDIDFYFKSKQEFDKISLYLKNKGCFVSSQSDDSELFIYKNIDLEHHENLIDISNPFKRRVIYDLITSKGFKEIKICNGNVLVPSAELNIIMLNAHIMKHSFGWGVGLRQICDIARAYYKLSGEIDGEELRSLYKKLGIRKWSLLLHSFLVDYMGLDKKYIPYEENIIDSKELLKIILKSGNFGFNLRDSENENIFMKKIKTLKSHFRVSAFSMKYAYKESFWLIINLIKGQFR